MSPASLHYVNISNAYWMWFHPVLVWFWALGPFEKMAKAEKREKHGDWQQTKIGFLNLPGISAFYWTVIFMYRQPPCQNLSLRKERGERKQACDFTTQQAASEGTERGKQGRGGVVKLSSFEWCDRGGRWLVGEKAVWSHHDFTWTCIHFTKTLCLGYV